MKSEQHHQQQQQTPNKDRSSKQIKQTQNPQQEPDVQWPFFAPPLCPPNQLRFWERKNCKTIYPNKDQLAFQSIMLRVGKKKKATKGYFYKMSKDGVLSYYKKESDKVAKGYLELTMEVTAHLIEQKNKKESLLVIQIERYQGLYITLFDTKPALTMQLFDQLKDHCIVSGFDRLYLQMEVLGKGSFASVFKVKHLQSDVYYAAKTYFKDTFDTSQHKSKFVLMIQNEILVLRKVIHPGVIRLHEVIQEKDRLLLVMEFVAGGDLYQLIKEKKKIPEKEAAFMIKGVCEALHEMHNHNYVHRDLKLENIMLKHKEQFIIKLVDFGFAEPINHKELVSKAGTPGYIPPEIFKLNPYTDKGDVFSVGVIFFSLISGISCFKGKNYQQVLDDNRKCEVSFDRSAWNDISKECKDLLKKMLEKKPQNRYTCADVLEDDWVLMHTDPLYQQQKIDDEIQRRNSHHTNRKSHYGSSDSQFDYNNDFSYHTNDLKSFYNRNSQRTLKTQKSIMSVKSNNQRMKMSVKSKTPTARQQQFIKSQTLKGRGKSANHQNSADGEQKSVRFADKKNKSGGNDASFGELAEDDSVLTTMSMKIFDDFIALSTNNTLFLKTSFQIFNQQKKPDQDTKINEMIIRKKQQAMNLLK